MSNTYAIAVQTNDEGVLEVWAADEPLTHKNAIEAQDYVRRHVPAGHNVIVVPCRLIPTAATILKAVE